MSLYPFGSVPGPSGPPGPAGASSIRQKSECYFSGLSLVIPTTPTNLINLIKNLTHTGSLAPFFNTTTNKLNVFNQNTTVTFKVNVIGAWSGASTNRSMTVDFPQTNGNSLTKNARRSGHDRYSFFPDIFQCRQRRESGNQRQRHNHRIERRDIYRHSDSYCCRADGPIPIR